jgi:peptidyl-prolyl cis-trans isomerase D
MIRRNFSRKSVAMLQAMRSKAAGIVVKILFSILVLSFAVWGIGDYSFLRRTDPTAIQVGSVKIASSTLDQQYRTALDRMRQQFGGQLDAETAKQFGLVDQVVQRLVTQGLLDKAASDLGIRVGDDVLRARIAADPQLQGAGGQFDPQRFQQLLFQNNLSEAGFVELYRHDLARGIVTDPLYIGVRPPDVLVDRLYRYRNERRGGESVFVAASSFADVGTPDDAQLKAVYDDNKDRFTAPEYRALTVVRASADDVASQITVTDQQIQDEYRARLSELRVPEKREVEQLLYADEAGAKAAVDKLKAGAKFDDLAKENKQSPETTRLGEVSKDDQLPGLTDAIFALQVGQVSDPVRSPFGWHLLRVSKIEPGKEPTLAEVKDKVTTDLKQRLAGDAAYDYATKLEDAVSNGASLEEAAAKVGLKAVKVPAVDAQGLGPDGKPVAVLAGATEPLKAVFDTAEGSDTQLVDSGDSAWFMMHVDGITPSALRPLADVRPQVVALWQDKQRQEAAKKRADQILEGVKSGKPLQVAGQPFGLNPQPIAPVLRAGGFNPRATVPPEVNARMFQMKPNDVATVPSRDGVFVVRMTQIVAADPASDADGVEKVRSDLRQQFGGDVAAGYVAALRQRIGVTIDQDAIDKVM